VKAADHDRSFGFIITPATVCDHVAPRAGDLNKFWLGPSKACANDVTTVRRTLRKIAAIFQTS
jgi:hypothetical protein